MKSLLKERLVAFTELYTEVFREYPKNQVILSVAKLLKEVKGIKVTDFDAIETLLGNVLNKTETFNVLLTLLELEKRYKTDLELQRLMEDSSYNQHRTMAINICDMYSSGATVFFGYIDCMFKNYFPDKSRKSFLGKGVAALIASTAESYLTGKVEDYTQKNIDLLALKGVTVDVMSQMVFELQKPYNSTLTIDESKKHVLGVLRKQQTYHTIQLCILIDQGVEKGEFGEQFQAIVGNDEGLYGLDETLNTSISKMYGMIAITNFGYLDKAKPGIIGELDSDHEGNHCNTFIDDTVCAIVSAACARLAHNNANTNSKPKK